MSKQLFIIHDGSKVVGRQIAGYKERAIHLFATKSGLKSIKGLVAIDMSREEIPSFLKQDLQS